MAENKPAYLEGNESFILGQGKMFSRMNPIPLDSTSVFNTKAELEHYAANDPYAYPGQVIAVANGDVSDSSSSDDYSLFIIRSDKSLQELGKNNTFSSLDDAQLFIQANPDSIRTGELITIASEENGYLLYMIKADKSLSRVSFDAETDVPDLDWSNILNKPTSAVADIDDAVTKRHEHENKTALDKVTEDVDSSKPMYAGNELAYKSELTWANVENKPDTIDGYGITDAYTKTQTDNTFVKQEEVVTTAAANKLLKLNDNAKFPANILDGIIPIENMPSGALERCVIVADDEARLALTTADVQLGDTVKVTDTNKMYFVKDESKLGTEEAFEVYTAGTATAVDWSGVQNKPTTLGGYGITDGVNVSDVVTVAEANKILKLNEDGVLPADITGNADTVDGKHASDFVAATDVVTTAEANKILKLNGDGALPADITGNAATATNVAWSGVQSTPTTLAGYGITDAVADVDIVDVAEANKVLRLDENGKLPADITGNAATATNVDWTGVQNTPTTVEGYGITDVYTQTEADNKFVEETDVVTVAEANKILKLNGDGDLPANITGNAATATNVTWSGVQNTPTTVEGYGITDAYTKTQVDDTFVKQEEVVTTAAANKILKLDSDAKLPASVISGVLKLENIPHGAIEHCEIVADDVARFALTNIKVQNGDTVKVNSTGKMYFVIDDTKLGTEEGYTVYTAGSATSVPWAGVTGTPTTVAGYGITDAYTKDETDNKYVNKNTDVVTVAEANKLLKLNADGDLPANITGNAATATNVAWSGVQDKPTSVAGYGILDAYTKTEVDGTFVKQEEVVTTAVANKVLKLNADAKLPADITGEAGSVAWANITGAPTSEVADIDDAVTKRHEHANKETIDKFGVNAEGKVTYDTDNEVAYMTDLTSIIMIGTEAEAATLPVGGLLFEPVTA